MKWKIRFECLATYEVEVEATSAEEAEEIGWDALDAAMNEYSSEYVWDIEGDPEFKGAEQLAEVLKNHFDSKEVE